MEQQRNRTGRTTRTWLAVAMLGAMFGVAACGSDPSPEATATADVDAPAASLDHQAPASEDGSGAEADGPGCALLTLDEVSDIAGSGVTEQVVDNTAGSGEAGACQWIGDDATINLFTMDLGPTASIDEIGDDWEARGAVVTPVSGIGDAALAIERPAMPIRYLAVQSGATAFQLQSNAPADQLAALGGLVVTRL